MYSSSVFIYFSFPFSSWCKCLEWTHGMASCEGQIHLRVFFPVEMRPVTWKPLATGRSRQISVPNLTPSCSPDNCLFVFLIWWTILGIDVCMCRVVPDNNNINIIIMDSLRLMLHTRSWTKMHCYWYRSGIGNRYSFTHTGTRKFCFNTNIQ